MNTYICFFPLSFKKYNKLDDIFILTFSLSQLYPYTTFYIIKIAVMSLKKATNIYIFTFNQN